MVQRAAALTGIQQKWRAVQAKKTDTQVNLTDKVMPVSQTWSETCIYGHYYKNACAWHPPDLDYKFYTQMS